MSEEIVFVRNQASDARIAAHLHECDKSFIPPLSSRVDVGGYARKIANHAVTFEAWSDSSLVGLVAMYCNDQLERTAYITSVSVLAAWTGKGIAARLLGLSIEHAGACGMTKICLDVANDNLSAIDLYKKKGFIAQSIADSNVTMAFHLNSYGYMNNTKRDYNVEINDTHDHKYAYGFDFDVMHPYMLQSFAPFFNKGSMLELGSFKGDFTRRFQPYFDDITCVEASSLAIEEAKRKLGGDINYVNALFEHATLPKRYNNIVMTHVLEHLDDPIAVLKRVNDEWLADGGRFFLVCPNANAPSRQIAVKMGLISHNAAVTPAEAEHGHRCTYSLDTLERDASAAGLKVIHRSGIFFKALANFQWDQLLQTDIISEGYLDGCYRLGQQYPDLCSSIFLLCERGR